MRVILPPLTNQYLNLTKNSSLAVAIGYPDLVSVFAGTTLSQTGQAIEIIAITMGVYLADLARHQRDHELLRMAASAGASAHERHCRFVLRPPGRWFAERPAPVKTTGFVGFLRTRLFNSPTNILLTILGAAAALVHRRSRAQIPAGRCGLAAATTAPPALPKMPDVRSAPAGPIIQAKFTQFIYGFYPEAERWRVNLTFILAALLLLPLSDPAPAGEGPERRPVLHRLSGRRVLPAAWRRPERLRRELDRRPVVGLCRQHQRRGQRADRRGRSTPVIGPLLWLLGKFIVLVGCGDLAG